MLQMTPRVQRLRPHLLFHIPSEPLHHQLRFAPHPLAPEFVVEMVAHLRRVQLVRVGVQERRPAEHHLLAVVVVVVVVVFGIVLDPSGALELLVVHLRVAQRFDLGGDGVEGGVQAHGRREVGLLVRFPVSSFAGWDLGEELVVVGGSVVVVVEYQEQGRSVLAL